MVVAALLLIAAPCRSHADAVSTLRSLDAQRLAEGEHLIKVADAPAQSAFKDKHGHYVDIGYRYKIFAAGGLPLWTYDEHWCCYVHATSYIDLSHDDLEELAAKADMALPDAPDLSFWYVTYAKLLALALLIVVVRWIYQQISGRSTRGGGPSQRQRVAPVQEAEAYAHDWRLHIVACTAKLAKIDGVVTKSELAAAEQVFESVELTGAQRPLAIDTFRVAKTGPVSFLDCVQFYRQRHQSEQDLLQILMSVLFAVTYADGEPNIQTRQALQGVCQMMGADYRWWADHDKRRKAQDKPTRVDAAYTVLGCQPTDALNIIKDRYRKLVKDFHPDTIMSKGVNAEFIKFAEERFKQIQAAYETIMEARSAKSM